MSRDHMDFFTTNSAESSRYRFFRSLSFFARRYRWLVFVFVVAVTAFSLFRIKSLNTDNSMESYFMENDPALMEYNSYLDTFSADQFAYILIDHKKPASVEDFKLVNSLTERLATEVPYIEDTDTDVSSLSHVNYIKGTGSAIELYKPREKPPGNEKEMKTLRQSLLSRPLYRNRLISSDETMSGITLNFKTPRDNENKNWQTVATEKIFSVLDSELEEKEKIHVVGQPVFNTLYANLTRKETLRNSFFTAAVLILLLIFFIRSVHGVIFPVSIVSVSLIWVFGIMSFLTDMNITTSIVPPLILAIGTCAVIHVLSEFKMVLDEFDTIEEAVDHAVGMVGFPVFLASITTAAGFLSLTVAPIKPVRDTGILAASGTMITFFLSVSFLPALLSFLSIFPKKNTENKKGNFYIFCNSFLDGISYFNEKHFRKIITFFSLLFCVAVVGIFFIKAETNWIKKIGDNFKIKQDYLFVDKNMGGSSSFELVFKIEDEDDFKSPEHLRNIDEFQKWIVRKDSVKDSVSLSDMVKELHMAFFEDNSEHYTIPETRQQIAQLLFLYESAGSRDLPRFITDDYKSLRVNVRTANMADEKMEALFLSINNYVDEKFRNRYDMTITGTSRLSVQTMSYIISSQLKGFVLAFVVISIMMTLLFRSLKVGIISMIPNILPIVFTLGFMGFAGIPLDTTVMLIASIAIGIAVDDTIHLFTRYRMEFLRTKNNRKALYETMRGVGRALLFTSAILSAGYLVVSGSDMKNIAVFGLLSSMTVALAWIADMFLAPSLILVLRPFDKNR